MTASAVVPPAAILIVGSLILPFLQERLRQLALLVLPLVALYLVWQVPDGVALQGRFLGYTLAVVKGDALSRLFATIFAVMLPASSFPGSCSFRRIRGCGQTTHRGTCGPR